MIEIEILKWDDFNKKRADVKNPGWLRLELDFPQSQSLFGINATGRFVFLSLLCLAGKRQSGKLSIDPEWFCHWAGGAFTTADLRAALLELGTRPEPALTYQDTYTERARDVHVTSTGVTDGRTDETDGRTDEEEERVFSNSHASASADWLSDISPKARATWIEAFGEELVTRELPRAKVGWFSDGKERTSSKAVYIRHWFQNASKDEKNAARAGPRAETSIRELIKKAGGEK